MNGQETLRFRDFSAKNDLIRKLSLCGLPYQSISYIVEVYEEKSAQSITLQRKYAIVVFWVCVVYEGIFLLCWLGMCLSRHMKNCNQNRLNTSFRRR